MSIPLYHKHTGAAESLGAGGLAQLANGIVPNTTEASEVARRKSRRVRLLLSMLISYLFICFGLHAVRQSPQSCERSSLLSQT